MAERVHPEPTPPPPPPPEKPVIPPADTTLKSPPPPPSASFVIQLPKDQIYRIPPPENEYRLNFYARRAAKRRRGSCRRCLAFSLILLSLLFISLASVIAILYLIFLPKLPSISIKSLSIHNFNLSSAAASPEIALTIRSENSNRKNRIYYRYGGSIAVDFSGEIFCRGAWPSFYQGKRNVTVFETALKGYGIRLSDNMRGRLTAAMNRREVPLVINAKMPMRMSFGAVKIWTVTVKLRCDVTVDKLTANARVRNESCRAKVDVF